MKKSFLLCFISITSLMSLISCKHLEEVNTKERSNQNQTVFVDKNNENNKTTTIAKMNYILKVSDIAQFAEVPNWQPEDIENQIECGYIVPQFLIDEYEKSGLNGKNMTIHLPSGKRIARLCVDDLGQYYFLAEHLPFKAALFKNDNESITVLNKSRNKRKFSGFGYYNNGNYNLKIIHMDYMDNSDAKLLDYTDDFSIIYYPKSNEIVCIRYGKEIGPRTEIDANLLQSGSFSYEYKNGTMRYNDGFDKLTIGFMNEGRLIYPIILKNREETSFHLYVVKEFNEDVKETRKTEFDEIQYGIYQGNVYTIQNVTKRESTILGYRLIVEDTEIHLQVQEMEEQQEIEIPIEE